VELNVTGLEYNFPANAGGDGFNLIVGQLRFVIGEVAFVMGHNGSGKSVLLKLLAGELRPHETPVRFRLSRTEWKASTANCGIVRQRAEESLAVDLTVAENLMLRLGTTSVADRIWPHRRLRSQAVQLVQWHRELARKLDQRCAELSTGQRQTVAFLAVAARRKPLLLLDEYLASTDRSTSNLLCRLAKQYAQSTPAAVVVVSHDVSMALEQADRILVLKHGELVHEIRRDAVGWNPTTLAGLLMPPGQEMGIAGVQDVPTAVSSVSAAAAS
jgi:ABC-type uncharacterized transport system ATPase component